SRVSRQPVQTERAPQAIGPYSQAVVSGPFIFVSGQIGLDPHTGAIVAGGAEPASDQGLRNPGALLEAAGARFAPALRPTIYLTDLADFTRVNEIYGRHFSAPYPARATVGVAALPRGARVEIDVVAMK